MTLECAIATQHSRKHTASQHIMEFILTSHVGENEVDSSSPALTMHDTSVTLNFLNIVQSLTFTKRIKENTSNGLQVRIELESSIVSPLSYSKYRYFCNTGFYRSGVLLLAHKPLEATWTLSRSPLTQPQLPMQSGQHFIRATTCT